MVTRVRVVCVRKGERQWGFSWSCFRAFQELGVLDCLIGLDGLDKNYLLTCPTLLQGNVGWILSGQAFHKVNRRRVETFGDLWPAIRSKFYLLCKFQSSSSDIRFPSISTITHYNHYSQSWSCFVLPYFIRGFPRIVNWATVYFKVLWYLQLSSWFWPEAGEGLILVGFPVRTTNHSTDSPIDLHPTEWCSHCKVSYTTYWFLAGCVASLPLAHIWILYAELLIASDHLAKWRAFLNIGTISPRSEVFSKDVVWNRPN